LATENEPVTAACEAMIVAAVDRNTIASRPQCGTSKRNGLLIAAGWSRISAAWPR
jgi:hypothetical protein